MNHYIDAERAELMPVTDAETEVFAGASTTSFRAAVGIVTRRAQVIEIDGEEATAIVIQHRTPEELRMIAHVYSTLASRMEALQRAKQAARGREAPHPPGG